jgi:hypothetical protein
LVPVEVAGVPHQTVLLEVTLLLIQLLLQEEAAAVLVLHPLEIAVVQVDLVEDLVVIGRAQLQGVV